LRLGLSAAIPAEWRVGGQRLSPAEPLQHGTHRAARIQPAPSEQKQ
jgi:hypothetical protein